MNYSEIIERLKIQGSSLEIDEYKQILRKLGFKTQPTSNGCTKYQIEWPEVTTIVISAKDKNLSTKNISILKAYLNSCIKAQNTKAEILLDKKITAEIGQNEFYGIEPVEPFKAYVYFKQYPELKTLVTFNEKGNGHHIKFDTAIKTISNLTPEYSSLMNKLETEHGCQFTRNGMNLTVYAPDYGQSWNYDHTGKGFSAFEVLNGINSACEDHYVSVMEQFEKIKQKLEALDFKQSFNQNTNRIEFLHSYLPQISFSLKGAAPIERVSLADIEYARNEIELATMPQAKGLKPQASFSPTAYDNKHKIRLDLGIPKITPTSEKPASVFIFDSCVMNDLTADHNYNRTYLDLIHCVSQLPNITVMFPEVVADWECRSRISIVNEANSRDSKRILLLEDASLKQWQQLYKLQEFFSKVGRRYYDRNNEIVIERSDNNNIYIQEGIFTKALYNLNPEKVWHNRPELSNLVHKILRKDIGEDMCCHMARLITKPNTNIYFITTDISFLNKSKNSEPLQNIGGNAISLCSGNVFYKELLNNKKFIMLLEKMYGHKLGDLSYRKLAENIMAENGMKTKLIDIELYGKNSRGRIAPNIEQTIGQELQHALNYVANPNNLMQIVSSLQVQASGKGKSSGY